MYCKKTPPCKKPIWGLNKLPCRLGQIVAIVCFVLLLVGTACRGDLLNCVDPLGCAIIRPNEPVKLATLFPTTGEAAPWGQELSRSINLAIQEQGGELFNHNIELITLNSACDTDKSQQALQTLEEEPTLLAILGPLCSDVATAVLPIVQRNNWLMISPASSLPALTENQPELAFFRTAPNHLHQATVAAHFAYETLEMRQAAVFQDETDFNNLLAQQFSQTFTELGGVINFQATLHVSQNELASLLDELSPNPPELIYLALFEPEATLLVNRLAENSQLKRAALIGGDSLLTPSFASGVGEAANGMYLTNPLFAETEYDEFLAQWAIRYDLPPTSHTAAYAYDAVGLLLSAIKETAVVGQNGSLVIGRAALRERLAASQDFASLSGALHCQPNGECGPTIYGVYQLNTAVFNNTWPPPLVWQFNQ